MINLVISSLTQFSSRQNKMDEDTIMSDFFSWVDTNEDNFSFTIMFEEAGRGKVSFSVD
jgi:hypothetical protein